MMENKKAPGGAAQAQSESISILTDKPEDVKMRLDKAVAAQKAFKEAYEANALIGVSEKEVQMYLRDFKRCFEPEEITTEVMDDYAPFAFECSAMYGDTRFIAIGRDK